MDCCKDNVTPKQNLVIGRCSSFFFEKLNMSAFDEEKTIVIDGAIFEMETKTILFLAFTVVRKFQNQLL